MPRLKQKLNFTLKFFGSTDDFKIPAVTSIKNWEHGVTKENSTKYTVVMKSNIR